MTGATPSFLERFPLAVVNKQCYARVHGYEFILDVREWSQLHGYNDYWNRLWFLTEYLEACLKNTSCPEWLFYVDADAMVMNVSIPLTAFTTAVSDDIDLILHDGAFYINSGAFFLRTTKWSLEFLRRWQEQARYPQTLADQTALWEVLLQWTSEQRENEASASRTNRTGLYVGACRPKVLHRGTSDEACFTWDTCRCKRCLRRAERCWRAEMSRLGHPYRHRRIPKIHFWSPDGDWTTGWREPWPRGFNFYASVGHRGNVERCHPAQLWRLGDLLVQDAKGLAQIYTTWWDPFYCPPNMTGDQLREHLEAGRLPKYSDLWSQDGRYIWNGSLWPERHESDRQLTRPKGSVVHTQVLESHAVL
ncbi:hypothetical protein CCYA_CCYA17G4419 [Cyanidiococcus yangmingshanensis]|nr:hypothetical protein CCYA_CCYA17G4419 [Cyanidiococcus yangmingshanensis]